MIQFKCDICGRVIEPSKFESVNVLHITKYSGSNMDDEEVTDHRDMCNMCAWLLKKFVDNGLKGAVTSDGSFVEPGTIRFSRPGDSLFNVEKFLNGDDEEDC